MKSILCFCVLLIGTAAHARPFDGLTLEHPSLLAHGAWDMRLGFDLGRGAELVDGPFQAAGTTTPIEVDYFSVPLEIRYGLTGRSEIGWGAAFESDKGEVIPATGAVPGTYFDAGGLQRLRFFGKWKIGPRLSWMIDMAFAGNNAVADGNDGFDFGVKFMYGLRLGAGRFLINTGVTVKGGGGDFNDNGVTGTVEEYQNVIRVGLGYVYPFTSNLSGTFEFAGSTSPFSGGSGFDSNDQLAALFGLRYGWSNRMFLEGGAGMGLLAGSPNVALKLGLSWLWGKVREDMIAREDPEFWAPTQELREEVARTQKEERERKSDAAMARADGAAAGRSLEKRMSDASDAFNRRDYVAAIAHYEAAIALKNDDAVLHYNLATCFFLMRRYHEARPYYEQASTLNPRDMETHLYLGYTYYYLGNVNAAAREWRKVLEIDPTYQPARDNLASLGAQ